MAYQDQMLEAHPPLVNTPETLANCSWLEYAISLPIKPGASEFRRLHK